MVLFLVFHELFLVKALVFLRELHSSGYGVGKCRSHRLHFYENTVHDVIWITFLFEQKEINEQKVGSEDFANIMDFGQFSTKIRPRILDQT